MKSAFLYMLGCGDGFRSRNSIGETAFVTPDGQLEYLGMPFRLCSAPSFCQRAMDKALGDYRDKIALVYIDVIMIVSGPVTEFE